MTALQERIMEKLQQLPEPALREVFDFVEFLAWRASPQEDPLLSVAGILSGEPISAADIEEELYGYQE
jgi:hypothetical protein